MYTSQKTDVKTKGFIPRILLVEITFLQVKLIIKVNYFTGTI